MPTLPPSKVIPIKEEPARKTPLKGIIRTVDGRKPRQATNKLRCGDCHHFNGGNPHPRMGDRCKALGIPASATAPDCYSPNIAVFRDLGVELIQQIHAIMAIMTPQQARVFAAVARTSGAMEQHGLKFLQQVYFCVGQGKNLSDYYRAWAFACSSQGDVQVVGHQYINKASSSATAVLPRTSLLTRKQFLAIKKRLIAQGAFADLPPRIQAEIEEDRYEPPSIDTAPQVLEEHAAVAYGGKKKKKGKDSGIKRVTGGYTLTQERGDDVSEDDELAVDDSVEEEDGL